MSAELFRTAARVAASAIIPGASIANLIYEVTANSIKKSKEIAEEGDLEKLQIEAARQEIESRIAEFQARVAQELAIARRIENALEVEIEEVYDSSGEGNLGVNIKEGVLNLGASGSGRKVTSRIYRFKGFTNGETEKFKQNFQSQNEND
jgi:hypothetical protein